METSPSAQLKDQSSATAEVTEAPRDPGLEGQLFKIISAVRIRDAPSASADIIGMAYAGGGAIPGVFRSIRLLSGESRKTRD